MASISAVIPVISSHIEHIPDVLSDLAKQTIQTDEIVLVASGFSAKDLERLGAMLEQHKAQKIVLVKAPLGPAGKNRNLGAAEAQSDLIMFLDVDDRYLPWRNERVLAAFGDSDFDALVHLAEHSSSPSLMYSAQIRQGTHSEKQVNRVGADHLARDTFPDGLRNRSAEVAGEVPTNLVLTGSNSNSPIHHAHATVKRSILATYRFHENFHPRNEDGLLLRDMLFEGTRVEVLLEHLSIFSTETSAVHWKAKLSWLAKFIGLSARR